MRQKLIDLMNFGADIEFSVRGKRFTILAWLDDGISICEKNSENEKIFSTPEELLKRFVVDNIPLGDIVDEVVVDFSTI